MACGGRRPRAARRGGAALARARGGLAQAREWQVVAASGGSWRWPVAGATNGGGGRWLAVASTAEVLPAEVARRTARPRGAAPWLSAGRRPGRRGGGGDVEQRRGGRRAEVGGGGGWDGAEQEGRPGQRGRGMAWLCASGRRPAAGARAGGGAGTARGRAAATQHRRRSRAACGATGRGVRRQGERRRWRRQQLRQSSGQMQPRCMRWQYCAKTETQRTKRDIEEGKQREEEMLTSRQLGSGTPSTGVGVRPRSRFVLARQVLDHICIGSSLISAATNSNPPCPTEARLVASRSGASSGAAANAHGGRGQW